MKLCPALFLWVLLPLCAMENGIQFDPGTLVIDKVAGGQQIGGQWYVKKDVEDPISASQLLGTSEHSQGLAVLIEQQGVGRRSERVAFLFEKTPLLDAIQYARSHGRSPFNPLTQNTDFKVYAVAYDVEARKLVIRRNEVLHRGPVIRWRPHCSERAKKVACDAILWTGTVILLVSPLVGVATWRTTVCDSTSCMGNGAYRNGTF